MSRPRAPRRPGRASAGQSTPLVAIALLVAALSLVPVGLLIRATVDRAEARTAADAAALAGALDGQGEARAVAEANGARLVTYREGGAGPSGWAEVTVQVGSHRASARAVREPVP